MHRLLPSLPPSLAYTLLCSFVVAYPCHTQVLEAAGDKFVVVDVFTTWCGPCKQISPRFAYMSTEYTDTVFAKIDMDKAQAFAQQYQITSIPTFVYFRHKSMVHKFSGADEGQIRSILHNLRTTAYDVLPNKTAVHLVGLQGAPQHNGRTGTITSFNPVKGRYTIQLADGGDAEQTLALKSQNLLQTVGVEMLGPVAAGCPVAPVIGKGKILSVAPGGGVCSFSSFFLFFHLLLFV